MAHGRDLSRNWESSKPSQYGRQRIRKQNKRRVARQPRSFYPRRWPVPAPLGRGVLRRKSEVGCCPRFPSVLWTLTWGTRFPGTGPEASSELSGFGAGEFYGVSPCPQRGDLHNHGATTRSPASGAIGLLRSVDEVAKGNIVRAPVHQAPAIAKLWGACRLTSCHRVATADPKSSMNVPLSITPASSVQVMAPAGSLDFTANFKVVWSTPV
jgi:hypothetical protein